MRQRRIKVAGAAIYHCISRTVNGERIFDDQAKERLRIMLWEVADFSGVEVLTYCIMSNHLHVLVRTPSEDASANLSHAELVRRYRRIYSRSSAPYAPTPEVLQEIFEKGGAEAKRWEERLRRRMSDVSEFMKSLKSRFSIWFNRSQNRFGTLWAERFKSVLIENRPFIVQTVSAYIDLNPIRAGLVTDPSDYRWSGYAEALAGHQGARSGLIAVMDDNRARSAMERYRMVLFGKGAQSNSSAPLLPADAVKAVQRSQGKLGRATLLRQRVRYFSEGLILGRPEFVRKLGYALDQRKTSRQGKIPLQIEESGEEFVTWRRPRRQKNLLPPPTAPLGSR